MKVSILLSSAVRLGLNVLAASVTLLATQTAQAATINFSYSGVEASSQGAKNAITSGSGSFSFSDSLTSISLSDLTSFSFSLTTTVFINAFPGSPSIATFNYDLSTLTSFSGSVNPPEFLTSLALATIPVNGINGSTFNPESFTVQSLQPNGASVSVFQPGFPTGGAIQIGTVTQVTSVPEPSTVTGILLFGGFLGAIRFRRMNS
jgi:hypothetical protein